MWLLDIFAVIGFVWILSASRVFKPFREYLSKKSKILGEFFGCWGCLSFWIAIIYYQIPNKEMIRFVLITVLVAVLFQLLYNKIK